MGKALGLYEALDGASLFKPPFRLYRPIEPVTTLLNGPRANIAKGVLLWRWGHADYKKWLSPPPVPEKPPSTSASPQTSSRTRAGLGRSIATWAPTRIATT